MTARPASGGDEAGSVPGLPGPIWFVMSFAAYLGLALATKSVVLNWIVGPLWLVVTLCVLPTAIGRVRARLT